MRLKPCPTRPALAFCTMIAVALIAAGCHSSPPSSSSSPQGAGFDGATLPAGLLAPQFTLRNQAGRPVTLSAQRGRVVVLAFLSTQCRACALAAQQVRGALDELPRGSVRTIFVSTDPGTDTPARVESFLGRASLQGRADFLSGTRSQLRPIWRAYRIAPVESGKAASEAATSVLLIDRDGLERVAFGLEQLTPETLAHDIGKLQGG